jgi:4-hydroxybenzoate polyprenyltransferase
MPSSSNYTDIEIGNWIDAYLPRAVRPYARLIRLDRPIGTWLLLLPCWWSLALADRGFPNPWYAVLFAIGAIVMRGAGCIINDIYDRDLDAAVERTRTRPLASGQITLPRAILFLKILLLIGLGVLLLFNRLTLILALFSMILVFIYPLMKRITWWPQLFLGLTFNWGALLGWTAEKGALDLPPFLLYAAGVFWTLGYDTVYAHQDKRDDELIGVKSTALLFGNFSHIVVAGFYGMTILLLALCGWSVGLGYGFYLSLGAAAIFMTFELMRWRMNDPENCLARFRKNRDFGLIVLFGMILGQII